MGSLGSLLSIARDAIGAHAAAVDVVGKNITNAESPGYVRRTALLETQVIPGASGGVMFKGTARNVDRYANVRLMAESGLRSSASARLGGLTGLESVLGAGTVGDQMSAMFGAATALSGDADDPTLRAQMLGRAADVARGFATAAQGLSDRRDDLASRAGDVASELTSRLAEAATLNAQIAKAQALGDPAADLRDRRDVVVSEIADRMSLQSFEQADGTITLLSAGTALLSGTSASSVSVSTAPGGALAVAVTRPGGQSTDVTSRLSGGQLGGIIEARDRDIVGLQKDLDQLAYDFANKVNTAHASGYGLDGVSGRNLFAAPTAVAGAAAAMKLDPAMVDHPERLAASSTAAGLPGGNDLALVIADIGSSSLGAGGPPASRFADLGGKLGSLQATAQSAVTLRDNTVKMAQALKEQASGVSVDEEMIDLTRYQRAFEASMKVLKTADELLEGLIRDL